MIYSFMEWILKGCSLMALGIKGIPNMELEATTKPINRTQSIEKYMRFPIQSLFTILTDAYQFKKDPLGVVIDDSNVTIIDEMCDAITNAMLVLEKGGKLFHARFRLFIVWLSAKLRVNMASKPNFATKHNANTFTGQGQNKGMKCSTKMLFSGMPILSTIPAM